MDIWTYGAPSNTFAATGATAVVLHPFSLPAELDLVMVRLNVTSGASIGRLTLGLYSLITPTRKTEVGPDISFGAGSRTNQPRYQLIEASASLAVPATSTLGVVDWLLSRQQLLRPERIYGLAFSSLTATVEVAASTLKTVTPAVMATTSNVMPQEFFSIPRQLSQPLATFTLFSRRGMKSQGG